jgi:hypothetical protein
MLRSDLSGVGVIMLASQCWDRPLMDAVASKLEAELMEGAVVIDYTDNLRATFGAPALEIEISVSWNPRQRMRVFVNRRLAS